MSNNTTWLRSPKSSTYARLLKPGQDFFGPGNRTIYTVYKVEPATQKWRNGIGGVVVVTTRGNHMHYSNNDRVRLA